MSGTASVKDPCTFTQHHQSPWFVWVRFPYNDVIKNFIKDVPGTLWDKVMRAWLVPLEMVYEVAEVAAEEGYDIDMNDVRGEFMVYEKETDA